MCVVFVFAAAAAVVVVVALMVFVLLLLLLLFVISWMIICWLLVVAVADSYLSFSSSFSFYSRVVSEWVRAGFQLMLLVTFVTANLISILCTTVWSISRYIEYASHRSNGRRTVLLLEQMIEWVWGRDLDLSSLSWILFLVFPFLLLFAVAVVVLPSHQHHGHHLLISNIPLPVQLV